MREPKNQMLGTMEPTPYAVKCFKKKRQNCGFYCPYIYGAIALQNSGGKVVFLGVPWDAPFGTNGSKSTLVTVLNINNLKLKSLAIVLFLNVYYLSSYKASNSKLTLVLPSLFCNMVYQRGVVKLEIDLPKV